MEKDLGMAHQKGTQNAKGEDVKVKVKPYCCIFTTFTFISSSLPCLSSLFFGVSWVG